MLAICRQQVRGRHDFGRKTRTLGPGGDPAQCHAAARLNGSADDDRRCEQIFQIVIGQRSQENPDRIDALLTRRATPWAGWSLELRSQPAYSACPGLCSRVAKSASEFRKFPARHTKDGRTFEINARTSKCTRGANAGQPFQSPHVPSQWFRPAAADQCQVPGGSPRQLHPEMFAVIGAYRTNCCVAVPVPSALRAATGPWRNSAQPWDNRSRAPISPGTLPAKGRIASADAAART